VHYMLHDRLHCQFRCRYSLVVVHIHATVESDMFIAKSKSSRRGWFFNKFEAIDSRGAPAGSVPRPGRPVCLLWRCRRRRAAPQSVSQFGTTGLSIHRALITPAASAHPLQPSSPAAGAGQLIQGFGLTVARPGLDWNAGQSPPGRRSGSV